MYAAMLLWKKVMTCGLLFFFFFLLCSTDTIEETVTVGVADGHSNVLTYVTCTICMPLSNG